MSAQPPPCGRAQFRLAPVCKWSAPAPEGTTLRWKLAYSPGRSHASRTPSCVGRLLAFCAPPNTRPDSVAGVRFRRCRSGKGRMPPTWLAFGFAKERPFPPLLLLQLHPLHSTRAGAPHGKQPPPLRPLGVGFHLATFCVSPYCALPQGGCYPLRFAYLRTNFQPNVYTPFSAI